MRTTPLAMKADLRTTQFGTARKPAALHWFSPQPANLLSTLSHQPPPWGPPCCCSMSLMRNPRSTAFLAHWLTCHVPSASLSATRRVPPSSAFSVSSIASRVSPLVAGVIVSRASQAASMAVSSAALDMVVPPGSGLGRSLPYRRAGRPRQCGVSRHSFAMPPCKAGRNGPDRVSLRPWREQDAT